MPPPRRQNPTGTGRRPRVAGRAGVPAGEKAATTKKSPDQAPPEKPTDAAVPTGKKSIKAEPKVALARTDSDTPEPTSTAVEAEPIEASAGTKKKKAPAPYRLSKPKAEPADDSAEATPVGAHSRTVRRLTVAAAVLAVVFAVVAVVAGLKPGTTEVTNEAWIDDAATNEVSAAATTALQTVFSYKADTIDQDQDAARAVLDGDRLQEYNDSAEQTKQGVLQTKTTSVAVVTDIGVSSLQGDRAEVVASMDISANQDGVDQGTVQTPVVVTMTRVDGTWLIAQIDNR